MNKNKKLLLSLGSIAAIAAPVAAVVACGSTKLTPDQKKLEEVKVDTIKGLLETKLGITGEKNYATSF